jgi:hypothetical protein
MRQEPLTDVATSARLSLNGDDKVQGKVSLFSSFYTLQMLPRY